MDRNHGNDDRLDWARIAEKVWDFIQSNWIQMAASVSTSLLLVLPEDPGATGVSAVIRQPWFPLLLTALSEVIPSLIRWTRNRDNPPSESDLVTPNLTFSNFVLRIMTMVTEVLGRYGLVPNHSYLSAASRPWYQYPPPEA